MRRRPGPSPRQRGHALGGAVAMAECPKTPEPPLRFTTLIGWPRRRASTEGYDARHPRLWTLSGDRAGAWRVTQSGTTPSQARRAASILSGTGVMVRDYSNNGTIAGYHRNDFVAAERQGYAFRNQIHRGKRPGKIH
jgi:hypothetical protein